MRALITGGSRGIGKAIADLYRQKGYCVEAPSREELDLASQKSVDNFIKSVGVDGYDIIVNNAGCNLINDIAHVKDDDIEQMMYVNLISPIRLMRGLVSYMQNNNFGRIVNIGSIWGTVSKPGRSVYSATKHGIHGVTVTLALELAPYNILVNTVAPGMTLTELTLQNNSPEELDKIKADIPLGRLAQPVEMAKVVYWLGSEENTYITGQQIVADGGFCIK